MLHFLTFQKVSVFGQLVSENGHFCSLSNCFLMLIAAAKNMSNEDTN